MQALTWHQVNLWRLEQHRLSPRVKRQDYLEAAMGTGGIQAQVMSAAEMALGVRVDGLTPQDVQSALWEERTLIKTWAMRGTLHLIPSAELPLYVAARSIYGKRDWLKWFMYFGISEAHYEAFMAAVPRILDSEPMTREQLANAVAEDIGVPELVTILLASSWGSLWKPLAWRGEICFGPTIGRNVTFVRPSEWIGATVNQDTWEPQAALREVARRYLRSYGPATVEDFAQWWGGGAVLGPARKLFRSMQDEIEEVDVEGWHAWALRTTIEPMRSVEAPQREIVRLLPLFDAYTLGLCHDIEQLLPREHKIRVFRPQGWITAVVLVDGSMKGVWEYQTRHSQTVVKISMFSSSPPSTSVKQGIEAEAERLSAFWNTEVVVEFEDP